MIFRRRTSQLTNYAAPALPYIYQGRKTNKKNNKTGNSI